MSKVLEPSIAAAPSPGRTGQGTAVEQSRAVAEVHGAIVVAQQVPRDITRAEREMRRSCAQKSLAEKAFYRYSRGGSQISGPSVQLARELARCFGNMQFGLVELRRDDAYGQSEMQAWAWDVETNTRSSTTFIVQHVRDARSGTTVLTDQRDIYENNANNGARRLREMIFAILPGWYTEDAVQACYETLAADGDEGTLPERIAGAVEGFGKLGVLPNQLEQKLGAPVAKWTPYDMAQLTVIYRSVMRGETRTEDEFPAARLAPADLTGGVQPANGSGNGHAPAEPTPSPVAEPPAPVAQVSAERTLSTEPGSSTTDQQHRIWGAFTDLEFTRDDRAEARAACETLAGRKMARGTMENLSEAEADAIAPQIERLADRAALVALLAEKSAGNP